MSQVKIVSADSWPDDACVSIKIVAAIIGSGVSTTWRYAATDPDFPTPIKISTRCTRFRMGGVRAWLAKKGGRQVGGVRHA